MVERTSAFCARCRKLLADAKDPAAAELFGAELAQQRGELVRLNELRDRARTSGYDDLCVFAHQPAYFVHMGFSIVPHTWLPEKLAANCRSCALFRRCDQFALVTDLDVTPESHALDHSIHV